MALNQQMQWLFLQQERRGILKGKLPEKRTDGWLEVEIGNFYNGEGDDNGDVEARLLDSRPFHAKCGLIIVGLEFRPI
uniref:F-box protein PP2-B10-like n=1 Tax=Nicotiana sylvestris TaxID=4096 RepID=A0A1U7YJV0_NICSY|nr:PREDICTED: F-box protein PP2-B10-like [Nicotiana sylvestris]